MYQTLNYFHNHIDDFNLSCNRICPNQLRVIQWNVRGINDLHKFDKLLTSLDHFTAPIDVIIVGETWLKDGDTSLYNIKGYNSIFSCRNRSFGGLAVYIRDNMEFRIIENVCIEGFHHINFELVLKGEVIDIHCVYRPPSYDFNAFHDSLESWLNKNNSTRPCLIFGDINVPVNLSNNNVVLKYKYLLESYSFMCTNTCVTRPASANILDHVLCKMSDVHRLSNHTVFHDLSDHCLILSEFRIKLGSHRIKLSKTVVNHDRLDREFKRYIDTFGPVRDANMCLQNISSKYDALLKDCTKTMTKYVNIKGTQCPWMSLHLWTLIKIKSNYLKKSRRDPGNMRLAEMFEHVSKKLDIAKKQAKKRYFEDLLINTSHSKLWKNINSIIGRSDKKKMVKLNVNGECVADSKLICEAFNDHFSTVGSNLAENITPSCSNPERHIEPVSNTIFLQPASANEVVSIIHQLKNNKSPGPDCIPVKAIKNNAISFSRILSDIFNLLIQTGVYPDCLKVAKVIPVFKSGDPQNTDNYRPISTLSVFTKILEKLLITRIVNFLDRNNILYSMQYGFRNGSSTTIAITELVDKVLEETDSKKYVGALFLDLKKAFDTINHNILLRKLECYGIRGVANNIIRSYLVNRTQYVSYDGEISCRKRITTGVPQGSNIGPLLFLVYINDITKIGLIGTPRLFADDTALFYPNVDPRSVISNMSNDLQTLQIYFSDNLLSLNLQKTKYMIFRSPRKSLPILPELMLGNVIIDNVQAFKYLGILLDCTLSWDQHIKKIAGKVSSMCGVLKRISSFVPRKVMLLLYFAHIHSHLNYMIIVWGRACKSKLKKLQTLQNRCIKIIFNLPLLYPTIGLYTDFPHKILPLQGMCEEQTLLMVHNILHNPIGIHNITLEVVPQIRNTRQSNHLAMSRAHSSFGQKRFTFAGPAKYNNLPRDIQLITNRLSFKANIKRLLRTNLPQLLI